MNPTYKITGGIYLVLDPVMNLDVLLAKLSAALTAGIQVVQIWNNWAPGADRLALVEIIGRLCQQFNIPVLINEDWKLLNQSDWLNGIHFDQIPSDFNSIKGAVGKPFLSGITCSSNLDDVIWADTHQLDYVSFCSMFPSPSAGTCDIVMPATVRQARALTRIPIFVSGGITPENLVTLKNDIEFDGVAVISGILSADRPEQKVKQYQDALGIRN